MAGKQDYSPERSAETVGAAAAGIKIISETTDKTPEFDRAHELIRESKLVVILGFGYHPTNVRRLRIGTAPNIVGEDDRGRFAFGSCYRLTEPEKAQVGSRCSGLRLGSPHHKTLEFLRENPHVVAAIG